MTRLLSTSSSLPSTSAFRASSSPGSMKRAMLSLAWKRVRACFSRSRILTDTGTPRSGSSAGIGSGLGVFIAVGAGEGQRVDGRRKRSAADDTATRAAHRLPACPAEVALHVAVLGAGVIGTSIAYYLARGGHRVTVLDRQPGAGLETSFANAGEVSPGYSAP